ncbi:MAG TPA: hypothetical protein VG675_20425 [Bryobacteraceae bacterium]|nr:hypothetical protein [Bryobacteraceae bacterium]
MTEGVSRAPARSNELSPELVSVFWETFRRRLWTIIHEYNCDAGETIWSIHERSSDSDRMEICGQPPPTPCLAISLDRSAAQLVCDFGPDSQRDRWIFEVLPGAATVRRSGTVHRVEDAAALILGHLLPV